MSKVDSMPPLTQELALEILNKTLEYLQLPENHQKIEEARDNIQIDVIKEYGYPEGREGIIKFSQMVRSLEREDPEVARLHGLIKAYYLPPVSVHTNNESGEERTSSN